MRSSMYALRQRSFVLGLCVAVTSVACGGTDGAISDTAPDVDGGGSTTTGGDAASPGLGSSVDGAADAIALSDAGTIDGATAPGSDGSAPKGFVHPGVLVNQAQLDFLKAKIAAQSDPWKSALALASGSKYGSPSYTPAPFAVVECGSYSNPDVGCTAEKSDAVAAYTQALLYSLTGDAARADEALAIMNGWSALLTDHTNSNAPLQSAWVGSIWPRAGELLRGYAGWTQADQARFAGMLRNVYLPKVIGGAANENGNWELSMAEATIAIGVFLDDQTVFEKGVALWRGRVPAYVYLTSDGALPVPPPGGSAKTQSQLISYWYKQSTFTDGLSQETCRDFGHVQYGFAAMINAAETARIQGVDLYADEAARITAGYEFHAKYLNGAAIPSTLCGGKLNALTPDPTWEIGFNEYATRLGVALPSTATLVTKIRPTGADHHMIWETLTHAEVGSVGLP